MKDTANNIKTVIVEDLPDEKEPEHRPYEHLRPYQFVAGQSGNPSGRPKDPIRSYLRRKFQAMTDLELDQWIQENKISGEFQWRQAEGNPTESKEISLKMPTPILGSVTQLSIEEQTALRDATMKAIEGTVIDDTA